MHHRVSASMEIGLYSFAETRIDPESGRQLDPGTRVRHLIEEIELADRVGLDVFGVGEHHRPDYAVSSPAVVLAAAAARTEQMRLTSAVSVLGSDDPVRVFQDFSLIDLISGGRAEIMAGRGSFVESFPLFGQDLKGYDELCPRSIHGSAHRRPDPPPEGPQGHRVARDGGRTSGPTESVSGQNAEFRLC